MSVTSKTRKNPYHDNPCEPYQLPEDFDIRKKYTFLDAKGNEVFKRMGYLFKRTMDYLFYDGSERVKFAKSLVVIATVLLFPISLPVGLFFLKKIAKQDVNNKLAEKRIEIINKEIILSEPVVKTEVKERYLAIKKRYFKNSSLLIKFLEGLRRDKKLEDMLLPEIYDYLSTPGETHYEKWKRIRSLDLEMFKKRKFSYLNNIKNEGSQKKSKKLGDEKLNKFDKEHKEKYEKELETSNSQDYTATPPTKDVMWRWRFELELQMRKSLNDPIMAKDIFKKDEERTPRIEYKKDGKVEKIVTIKEADTTIFENNNEVTIEVKSALNNMQKTKKHPMEELLDLISGKDKKLYNILQILLTQTPQNALADAFTLLYNYQLEFCASKPDENRATIPSSYDHQLEFCASKPDENRATIPSSYDHQLEFCASKPDENRATIPSNIACEIDIKNLLITETKGKITLDYQAEITLNMFYEEGQRKKPPFEASFKLELSKNNNTGNWELAVLEGIVAPNNLENSKDTDLSVKNDNVNDTNTEKTLEDPYFLKIRENDSDSIKDTKNRLNTIILKWSDYSNNLIK